MERRTFVRSACSLGIGSLLIARPALARAAGPVNLLEQPLVEDIRRHTLLRLGTEGLDTSAQQLLLHQQFPQAIEQNFAAMSRAGTSAFLGAETPWFLGSLFSTYRLAAQHLGREERLLQLLVQRLNLHELARLAPYTGTDAVFSFMSQRRPAEAARYLELAQGVLAVHDAGPSAAVATPGWTYGTQSGNLLDHTIHEIYLSFRTAPVGSMSVRAAAFETAHLVGRHLTWAFLGGYTVGTYMAPVIERHAPGLWHNIGAMVNWIVEQYRELVTPEQKGRMQKTSLEGFSLDLSVRQELFRNGGDYQVVFELPRIAAGGLPCFDCSQT